MVEYDASEIIVKGLVLELIPVQVIQARPTRGQAFVLVQKKRVRNSKGSGCFPFHFALLAFILAVPPCSPPPPSFTAVPMPATPPPSAAPPADGDLPTVTPLTSSQRHQQAGRDQER